METEYGIALSILAEMRAVLVAALPFSTREAWSVATLENANVLPVLLRMILQRGGGEADSSVQESTVEVTGESTECNPGPGTEV